MPLVAKHMSRELLIVAPSVRLADAAERMHARDVGAVVVVENDRLVGILTERDLLRAVAAGLDPEARVSDWMTSGPETIAPDETTAHAGVLMIHGGFRHLPVLDGAQIVGMLSIRDLMRVVLEDSAPRGV